MNKIAICGAGGHGAEIKMIIEDINDELPKWELVGFFDPALPKGSTVHGLPVLGNDEDLVKVNESLDIVIAMGDTAIRAKVFEKISQNKAISFPALVHPKAYVARSAVLEGGVVLFPFSFVSCHVVLGKAVLLNCAAQVGHHVRVGDYSMIMPHSVVLGDVTVGQQVLLGANSTVLQGLKIDDNVVVGTGSVVLQSVPGGATVLGNPARTINRR